MSDQPPIVPHESLRVKAKRRWQAIRYGFRTHSVGLTIGFVLIFITQPILVALALQSDNPFLDWLIGTAITAFMSVLVSRGYRRLLYCAHVLQEFWAQFAGEKTLPLPLACAQTQLPSCRT